jgi:DHA1 family inner membrane transport protein
MVAAVLVWGALVFASGTPLQARIVEQASTAPNLASTLNQGAFNLGNASGASLGGALLTAGFSYRQLPIASGMVTLCMLALALLSAWLDRKNRVVLEAGELAAS